MVCKACYVKYKKAHDSYVKKEVAYIIIGVVFAALLISVGRSASSLLAGLVIIAFMYILSLLSYMPSLVMPNDAHSTASSPELVKGRHVARAPRKG